MDAIRDDPVLRAHGLVILDVLGEGGTSIVYRARDERHDRDVAIKVVRPDTALEHAEERFAREVRLMAGLRHAHILPLYDSGILADRRVFAVMPVAQGRPLRAMIDEGPLAVADAVRLAREVAEALAFLHARGYAHRDVKPENILVEAGHAVLTDFGLGSPLDAPTSRPKERAPEWFTHAMRDPRLTDAGNAVGTVAYMSPEALLGHDTIDERTDLYALGLVLYEMLAGGLPDHATSTGLLLAHRTRHGAPSLTDVRPEVPAALDAIVQRCTAPDVAQRYRHASELVAALNGIGDGTSGAHPRAGPREPWRSWIPLSVMLVALGGSALLWHDSRAATELDPHRVVVADLVNDTGDSTLARVGTLAGDVITAAITRAGRLDVVNAVVAVPSRQQRHLPVADSVLAQRTRELVTSTRAGLVVTGAYFETGGALDIVAEVTDAKAGRVLGVAGPITGTRAGVDQLLRTTADSVVAILNRRHAPPTTDGR